MDATLWTGHDLLVAEAGVENGTGPCPRRRLTVTTSLLGAACTISGFVAVWNPWRLVVLGDPGGRRVAFAVLTFGVLVVGVGVARLVGRRRRAGWWLSVSLAAVGGSLFGLVLVAIMLAVMVTPMTGNVIDEERVGVGDGVTVVRRVWTVGLRNSCVDFEVRVGRGFWVRGGERTTCVPKSLDPDWVLSVDDGAVVVTRSDGSACRYAIDRAGLRFVAEDAVACTALVVR